MPDLYVIGDTIRFTAGIQNMNGAYYDPEEIKIDVIGANGIKLLENGIPIKTTTGNYYYDWQIQGITDRYNLIVVWRWDNNIKRVKFKAIPETEW
ncbi:hypothetical protein [Methanoculleus sp.]|uniref:hypothetical protein n=1 Tax=Methanoculleus sp. TaxID=90427 RepID=UPI0025CC997D|nr:hypothetical protein [Methanoculleus sp.]MCK9320349.1 hypothetical protein [Methanoculleus sp.]